VLWHCWLGSRKGIRPVKMSGGMQAWLCVWGMVQICIWPSWCHCHPLSLAPVNPNWYVYFPGFTLLVLAHPGSPRQNPDGRKTVGVVVVIFACWNSVLCIIVNTMFRLVHWLIFHNSVFTCALLYLRGISCGTPFVCVSVISQYCIEMAKCFELFLVYRLSSTYRTLCCKEIYVSLKIRVLLSGTLS